MARGVGVEFKLLISAEICSSRCGVAEEKEFEQPSSVFEVTKRRGNLENIKVESCSSQAFNPAQSPFSPTTSGKLRLTFYAETDFDCQNSSGSKFNFFSFFPLLGSANCGCLRMFGNMLGLMGEGAGSSPGSVLRRLHWPSHCRRVTSVYPLTSSQACCRLVWTEPSLIGVQHRSFRKSGECQNNKFCTRKSHPTREKKLSLGTSGGKNTFLCS